MTAFKSLNNAEVTQFLIYLTEFKMFERLFERSNYSWPIFLERIRDIQKSLNDVQSRDPFIVLAEYLNS